MAEFIVKGPLPITRERKWNSRGITTKDVSQFWKLHKDLSTERGCYLFAIRAGKGYTPVYVGKATVRFKNEAIERNHKLPKYNAALKERKKGTPVLFLIALSKTKGPINKRAIDQVESFLIQSALMKNPNLQNDRKTKSIPWNIRGIVRSGRGKLSKPARELRRCMSI